MDERLAKFVLRGPADPASLAEAERSFGLALPTDYKRFMLAYGGGEGWIGEHYLVLRSADELISFNADYGFKEFAPSLIGFGGDGSGEAFAFDKRLGLHAIVTVPFIGMSDEDAIVVASSLDDLIDRMMREPGSLF